MLVDSVKNREQNVVSKEIHWEFDTAELALGTRTFSYNLKFLMDQTSCRVCDLCDALRISRSQLSRFIGGQSFPKPHILMATCQFFNVDNRVLTHQILGKKVYSGSVDVYHIVHNNLWGKSDVSGANDDTIPYAGTGLEEGWYKTWYQSRSNPERLIRSVFAVNKKNGTQLFSGREYYDCWESYPIQKGDNIKRKGICIGEPTGFGVIFCTQTQGLNGYASFERNKFLPDIFTGFTILPVHDSAVKFEVKNMVVERIGSSRQDITAVLNSRDSCSFSDAPWHLSHYICPKKVVSTVSNLEPIRNLEAKTSCLSLGAIEDIVAEL